MFGGENLDVLYVTSMAQPPLPRFPEDNQLRGSLFAIYDLGRDRRSGTALRRLNEPPARRDNNNTRRTDSDPDTGGGAHHAVATPRSKHDYDNNQSHTCRRTTWQKRLIHRFSSGFATGLLANLGA